ncbi:DUF4400 domain-containing protein [Flexistipes sp.]|uniref:DUF4400 domain-containing protein n=1 Tax=Flexistipes sp. TaxID=3088135 RepID=UPI002E241855|nr:DUF4400 domain-containing protein [Flexistipes sp.]
MSSESMTDRRFIFFATILLIIGIEMFALRYMLNTNESYGQRLVNAEVDNYVQIAGGETKKWINAGVHNIKSFLYHAVKKDEEVFNMLMNSVGVPIIAGFIRSLSLLYALPLIFVGSILGFAEGRIAHNKKIEQFKIKSTILFHWTHRSAVFFFVCMLVAYLLCPIPSNPYLVVYGYGLLAYMLVYNSVANLPIGNL